MTRKDYVALAEALQRVQPITSSSFARPRSTWYRCVDSIADVLETDNPRFDRERFVKACQGEK